MCVFMSKSGRVCMSVHGSQGWRCEVGDGKVLCESFSGQCYVYHTHTQLSVVDTFEKQK